MGLEVFKVHPIHPKHSVELCDEVVALFKWVVGTRKVGRPHDGRDVLSFPASDVYLCPDDDVAGTFSAENYKMIFAADLPGLEYVRDREERISIAGCVIRSDWTPPQNPTTPNFFDTNPPKNPTPPNSYETLFSSKPRFLNF